LPEIDKGTVSELAAPSRQRGLDGFYGLEILIRRGQLFFASMRDGDERPRCWLVTDGSQRNASARRLDGKPWQSLQGQPKAKTLKGSQAAWPLGASRLENAETILFCEGTPDLLAAATFAAFELDQWEAVAMPGRMPIHREALELFTGKNVFLFAHNDEPGLEAAREWLGQLIETGSSVQVLYSETPGRDLNDALNAGERISIT
jgi:hypothetical protein